MQIKTHALQISMHMTKGHIKIELAIITPTVVLITNWVKELEAKSVQVRLKSCNIKLM